MRGSTLLFVSVLLGSMTTVQPPPPPLLTVCPQGPPACDFASIQEAVQAANPGDILWIYPGTYQESLIIDKSLKLVASQREKVIIQPPGGDVKVVVSIQTEDEITVILDGIAVIVPPEACKDPQIGNCPGGVVLSGGD